MADGGIIAEPRPGGKGRLILMTRYPVPGHSKTRLIPALGPEGAALLQRRMTEQAVRLVRTFEARFPVEAEVRYAGGGLAAMRAWLGNQPRLRAQGAGDLGTRLGRAFAEAFASGASAVVAVGADCPALAGEHLAEAFLALRRHELVVGPAKDGGYYLLGLAKPAPALFRDIPWGGGEVLAVTLARAAALGLRWHGLEPLADVDRPEDLPAAFSSQPGE
ncbi:MAG: TIGR04282 family arsenosugar biosynthesis glycosyltransferase [Thermodesulfobacteriota bacterium]